MAGTTNSVRNVENIIPPTTAIPMATRLWAPSPSPRASGSNPKMVARLVIRIGLKRDAAAYFIASTLFIPAAFLWLANSTIKYSVL